MMNKKLKSKIETQNSSHTLQSLRSRSLSAIRKQEKGKLEKTLSQQFLEVNKLNEDDPNDLKEKLLRACMFGQKAIKDSKELQARVRELEEENYELNERLQMKNEAYDELEEKYSIVRLQKNDVSVRFDSLLSEVKKVKLTLEDTQKNLKKVTEKNNRMKKLLERAKCERYLLKKRNTLYQARIDSDKEILKHIKKRHSKLKRRLSVTQNMIATSRRSSLSSLSGALRKANSDSPHQASKNSCSTSDFTLSEISQLSNNSACSTPGLCQHSKKPCLLRKNTEEIIQDFVRKRSKSTDFFALNQMIPFGINVQGTRRNSLTLSQLSSPGRRKSISSSRRESLISRASQQMKTASKKKKRKKKKKVQTQPKLRKIKGEDVIYGELDQYEMKKTPSDASREMNNGNTPSSDPNPSPLQRNNAQLSGESLASFMNTVHDAKNMQEAVGEDYEKMRRDSQMAEPEISPDSPAEAKPAEKRHSVVEEDNYAFLEDYTLKRLDSHQMMKQEEETQAFNTSFVIKRKDKPTLKVEKTEEEPKKEVIRKATPHASPKKCLAAKVIRSHVKAKKRLRRHSVGAEFQCSPGELAKKAREAERKRKKKRKKKRNKEKKLKEEMVKEGRRQLMREEVRGGMDSHNMLYSYPDSKDGEKSIRPRNTDKGGLVKVNPNIVHLRSCRAQSSPALQIEEENELRQAQEQLKVIHQLGLLEFYDTLKNKEKKKREKEEEGLFEGKSGYLLCTKQRRMLGRKFGWTTYVKYFVVATQNVLLVFCNETCHKMVEFLPYCGSNIKTASNSLEVLIETTNGKTWVVRASTRKRKMKWMKVINNGIQAMGSFERN